MIAICYIVFLCAGIKFIPLRTPGGELIPGSGLFVQIKKTVVSVPDRSDKDVQETVLAQQIGSEEIAVMADIEDKSSVYCSDEDTILPEDSFESKTAADYYCERREQQLTPARRRFSTPAALTYTTNGHFKGSMQLNVIAEVNDIDDDTEELSTISSSDAAP